MKKILFISVILLLISSCKVQTIDYNKVEETVIANKALLLAKSNYKEFILLTKPDNELIMKFKDGGFEDEQHNIYNNRFKFQVDKTKQWDSSIALGNKILYKEIVFVNDYNKVAKVPYNQPENVRYFYSISNVMFSEDQNYAIVNVTSTTNYDSGGSYEGQMYIFKRVGNEWVYQFTYMTAIS